MTLERLKMAGCVIKDEAGRLLLLHRKDKFWEFPGGKVKVEKGEVPIVAARREGLEETGRLVRIRRGLGNALMTFVDPHRKRYVDYHYFDADIPKEEGPPVANEKDVHDAVEFVTPEELAGMYRLGQLAVPVVVYLEGIPNEAA